MDARILNVFEHSADYCRFAVAYGVNIKLYRVFEEFVEQYGLARGGVERLPYNPLHFLHFIDYKHSPASKHEARAQKYREAYLPGKLVGLFRGRRRGVYGLFQIQLFEDFLKYAPVFGGVYGLRRRSDYVYAVCLQLRCQV